MQAGHSAMAAERPTHPGQQGQGQEATGDAFCPIGAWGDSGMHGDDLERPADSKSIKRPHPPPVCEVRHNLPMRWRMGGR